MSANRSLLEGFALVTLLLVIHSTSTTTLAFSFSSSSSSSTRRRGGGGGGPPAFTAGSRDTTTDNDDSNARLLLPDDPWIHNVPIDYSAANEYIQAHYGSIRNSDQAGDDDITTTKTYFPLDSRFESVYDARLGVYKDYHSENKDDERQPQRRRLPATMISCGFTLLSNIASPSVEDWTSRRAIEQVYLPQLRQVLVQQHWGRNATLSYIVFWHPLVRGVEGEDKEQQPSSMEPHDDDHDDLPRSGYVSTAHIDTDLGAYTSLDAFLNLIEKNRAEKDTVAFPRQEILQALQERRRFSIVNAWRNIDGNGQPVVSNPLAVMATRYENAPVAFPDAPPNHKTSRWYTFPYMKPDELLLFYQYDRDSRNPSDIWHCALTTSIHDDDDDSDARHPSRRHRRRRKSMEVRCFLVFDDIVPSQFDRLRHDRQQSKLTQKQSATFCSQQAVQRREQRKERQQKQ